MKNLSTEQNQKICQLMRQCGQEARRMSAEQFQVTEKGPNDYVTNVDRALDRQLLTAFSTLFPKDGVITEENTLSRSAFNSNHQRLWCIDPLDGTEDFIQKSPEYSVMVGLLQNDQPVAGWIYAPEFERLYYGGPDWGIFQVFADGLPEQCPVIQPSFLPLGQYPVLMGTKDQARFGAAIAQLIPELQLYSLGSFGLKVMEVICGRAALYLYFNGRVKLWDTVGPLALAQAAGLVCCDLEGHPIRFTPDAIDADTLAHQQAIIIGWPQYVEQFYPKIRQAIASVSA